MQAFTTVGAALAYYQGANPKEAHTVRSIIKNLFPEVDLSSPAKLQAFLMELPLAALRMKLAADGLSWTTVVEQDLIARDMGSKTHLDAYPRYLKRFFAFTTVAGMVKKTGEELLPEWEDFLAKAMLLVPQSKQELSALVDAGVTLILDKYEINVKNLIATATKLQNVRSALRRLAKLASAAGLTPQMFAEQVLLGDRQSEVGKFAGQNVYCSYCRCLWNATVMNYPDLDLALWPDRRRFLAIAMESWATSLYEGVTAAVFPPTKTLAKASIKNYKDTVCTLVGIVHQSGFDLAPIMADLSPNDAVRLLFQGWPSELQAGSASEDAARVVYRRLLLEPGYKEEVLAKMRAYEDGRHRPLGENPFIAEVLSERYGESKYSSAEKMLDRVYSINAEYLHLRDSGLAWIRTRLKQVSKLMEINDSAYDEKKKVVFKHRLLFKDLLTRAGDLYQSLDERYSNRGPHWATFVRDLTYVALATMYPLRVKNHQTMKLHENYSPSEHVLTFARHEVKNSKPIEFELPADGPLNWVRDLVDLYLQEARPILLRGATSAYFFVGNHQAPNAKGYLQRQAFNDILNDFTTKHLRDVVPAELGNLNPHLFRHIAATYQILVRQDCNMAAMLLNDTPETIYQHYADILSSSRSSCMAFYNDFGSEM